MGYHSAIKKEWNDAICSNMDGPRDYHTTWSKKETNTTCCHLYVESKTWHKWTHLWSRITDMESRLLGAVGWGEIEWKVGLVYVSFYIKNG